MNSVVLVQLWNVDKISTTFISSFNQNFFVSGNEKSLREPNPVNIADVPKIRTSNSFKYYNHKLSVRGKLFIRSRWYLILVFVTRRPIQQNKNRLDNIAITALIGVLFTLPSYVLRNGVLCELCVMRKSTIKEGSN